MRGRLIRFLSALAIWTKLSESGDDDEDEDVDEDEDKLEDAEDVELTDAEEEDVGEERVEMVDEVDERCRSIGEGFSSSLVLALALDALV